MQRRSQEPIVNRRRQPTRTLWSRLSLQAELLVLLLFLLLCAACRGQPARADPWAPYRQAMRPSTQAQLDELGLLPVYHIRATLETQGRRLAGFQTVRFPNTSSDSLPEIVFRLYPNLPQFGGKMDVQVVKVNGADVRYEYNVNETVLEVRLEKPLPPGEVAEIYLVYALRFPSLTSPYVLFGENQGVLSLPYFYPILALRDAQGWHRHLAPAYADASSCATALYQVSLTADPNLKLVTPGVVVSQTLGADGLATWEVVTGPVREFVVVASPDFQSVEGQVGDVRVRSWFLPEDGEAGRAALNHAMAALRVYQEWFGPYPFPDFSVAEAPLGVHGMEFPTMSLIGVDLYRDRRRELEYLVAHEIAHQWWYNQVGNDQVRFPWLDEGLAEYSAYLYFDQVYGRQRADTLLEQRWAIPYQYLVSQGKDAPVNQPAFNFEGNYEAIVYGKAALFFHHLHQELGDDRFREALHEYLSRYRYDLATPDRLMAVMNEVAGQDLTPLYNQWIRAVGAPPTP
ncbi:MAG: M1 family metallopeptidase [Anaerolineae bacterium]